MKLTPELLAQAPSGLNPNKERELNLRGYKIPVIENLGVTRDQHDCIDFTDNSVAVLGNLPLLRRLRTLLLANNRVSALSSSLHLSAPGLTTLVLTNNAVAELGDLEPLQHLRHLTFLSLLGNPVREKKWYREWLAWRIPSLRVLDFQRIRDKERQQAKTLFTTADGRPNALADKIAESMSSSASRAAMTSTATADEPKAHNAANANATPAGQAGRLMSKEEQTRVKAAIAAATSVDEIRRLELSLKEGFLPTMDAVGA